MSQDLTAILDELADLARGEDDVSIDDVLGRIGPRGHGATLLLPGLLGITPIGAIPGVPTLLGVLVALLSLQVVIGRDRPWVPGLLGRRAVTDERLEAAVRRLRGPARWIDARFGRRLPAFTGSLVVRAAALHCLALACLLPPLEVVPFGALVPFGAIALLGLALTLLDGVLMLAAFAAGLAALWGVWVLLPL